MNGTVSIDLNRAWQLSSSGEMDGVVHTAVSELQQTLAQICGHAFPIVDVVDEERPFIYLNNLNTDPDCEAFSWQVAADQITIQSQSSRGLLAGVYQFLAQLGCAWLAPGDLWTQIPTGQQFEIPAAFADDPAFPGRSLIIGHHAFMKDVNEWIVWAARNHYNNIFLHMAPDDFGGGSVPEWQWVGLREDAVRLMQARGMTIEYGGHGLPSLLPRKLFKQMPDAFREENGRRVKQYNFCPSSAEGMQIVRENARQYFAERAGYDVYHVWADDIPGGGWCSCSQCAGYSTSDQLLLATNAIADVLAELNPAAEISFIAYLDTEMVPTQIKPRPNVCLLWAPRTRNYGRSLKDATCPVNTPYYNDTFAAQIEYFKGAGAVRVFEYYSDAILFKSVLPVLSHVLQQDLLVYRDLGVHTMQTLMTGTRPWVTAQLINWLFGQLTWQPEQDVERLVARFCRAAFGEAADEMVGYYDVLERAFTAVLHQTPDQREQGIELTRNPRKLVKKPLADMEDPVNASVETLVGRAAQQTQLLGWIDEANHHLTAAQIKASSPRLQAEAKGFELIQKWLQFATYRLALYAAIKKNPIDPQAKKLWQQTQAAYEAVQAWGTVHIEDPLYQRNFKMMTFAMWGLRLRRIGADCFSRNGRLFIDIGSFIKLVGGFVTTIGAYKRRKKEVLN
ncbi:MAG: DUF4838 domain-containing protein [Chloroflexi bacterium]|nr:MAG: DUF4838 domain-containing protein [Chloroflexota bacterium]